MRAGLKPDLLKICLIDIIKYECIITGAISIAPKDIWLTGILISE